MKLAGYGPFTKMPNLKVAQITLKNRYVNEQWINEYSNWIGSVKVISYIYNIIFTEAQNQRWNEEWIYMSYCNRFWAMLSNVFNHGLW